MIVGVFEKEFSKKYAEKFKNVKKIDSADVIESSEDVITSLTKF